VKRKTRSKKEQLQFILEGFPGIGAETAKKLLKEFKTLKNIINASQEELTSLIGKKAEIFRLSEECY
jgi:Fanconi anemia group M protein